MGARIKEGRPTVQRTNDAQATAFAATVDRVVVGRPTIRTNDDGSRARAAAGSADGIKDSRRIERTDVLPARDDDGGLCVGICGAVSEPGDYVRSNPSFESWFEF